MTRNKIDKLNQKLSGELARKIAKRNDIILGVIVISLIIIAMLITSSLDYSNLVR